MNIFYLDFRNENWRTVPSSETVFFQYTCAYMYVTFPTRKGKKTLPLCAVTPINKKNTAGQKVTEEFVDNGFMLGALH